MKSSFTTFYVVRHGESKGNLAYTTSDHTYTWQSYGILGSPLTEMGTLQAQKRAEELKPVHFDAIFSSDLTRARQTAEIIAYGRDIPVQQTSKLRERVYGKTFSELSREKKQELEESINHLTDEEKLSYSFFPDMESRMSGAERLKTFLLETAKKYPRKQILIVCHGNIMRTLLIILNIKTDVELQPGAIENTGYFVVKTNGKDFTLTKTCGIHKIGNKNER